MKKTKPYKLELKTHSLRVLTPEETSQVAGAGKPTTQPCCDLRTELLNPFTH